MSLKQLIDIWNVRTFLFYINLYVLHLLKRIGLKTQSDPWRYTTRVYHHLDHCSFGLTAFGLKPLNYEGKSISRDQRRIQRALIFQLSRFIYSHPELHKKLAWSAFSVEVQHNPYIDFVLAHFTPNGTLKSIELLLDDSKTDISLEQPEENVLFEMVVDAYNQLRFASDESRPRKIRKKVRKDIGKVFKGEALAVQYEILDRILAAVFIHFETELQAGKEKDNRFSVPKFFTMRPLGFGCLNIHVRFHHDERCDLWIRFNHAVIDGVLAAQFVEQLVKNWNGIPVIFPAKGLNMFQVQDTMNYRNRIPLCLASGLIEFEKLLEYRRMINSELSAELESPVTLAGMLLWGLGCSEMCKSMKFLMPIDLPEDAEHERTVGLVYIRPGKYSKLHEGREEFIAFQAAFNKQVQSTRLRNSIQYQVLEEFSILPLSAYYYSARYLRNPMQEVIGSAVLTILKEATFVTAPYSRTATDCIINFGNVNIEVDGGKKAGAVTIKAPEYDIKQYCEAFVYVVKDYGPYVRFIEGK